MKKLFFLICFATLYSCKNEFKGGFDYNENFVEISDSTKTKNNSDSFSINNIIRIGPKVLDTLIIK